MLNLLNINNTDANLEQGQLILNRKKNLTTKGRSQMKLIEQTTSPNLSSIIEGLGSNSSDSKKNTTTSKVSVLEDQFNKTLAKYTKNYQILMDELITNNKNPALQKYAGKNVKNGNNYYYVNNFGFTHAYNADAWSKRHNTCSLAAIDISQNELDQLIPAQNMGVGQPCNIAGYNVENETSSEHAWVDIKGVKSVYPKDLWKDRSTSCQTVPMQVSSAAYAAIPTDNSSSNELTKKSLCNRLNVDPKILQNLASLNDKLLTLAKELLVDTKNLAVTDVNLKKQLETLNSKMSNHINSLENDKQQFSSTMHNLQNVSLTQDELNTNLTGARESSQFKLSSYYLRYLFWLAITIILFLFTLYHFEADTTSNFAFVVVLIVALLLLYKLWTYIHYKFI